MEVLTRPQSVLAAAELAAGTTQSLHRSTRLDQMAREAILDAWRTESGAEALAAKLRVTAPPILGIMRALANGPARSGRQSFPRGSVAQSVEHWTFNPLVVGSIPTRPTKPLSQSRLTCCDSCVTSRILLIHLMAQQTWAA